MIRYLFLAFAAAAPLWAAAQEFPSRPVTIVVPFPAGLISGVVGGRVDLK